MLSSVGSAEAAAAAAPLPVLPHVHRLAAVAAEADVEEAGEDAGVVVEVQS